MLTIIDSVRKRGERKTTGTINNRLREIRKMRGLGVVELSDKSGVNRQTISMIEHGEATNITVKTMKALADALDTTVTDIFFELNGNYKRH